MVRTTNQAIGDELTAGAARTMSLLGMCTVCGADTTGGEACSKDCDFYVKPTAEYTAEDVDRFTRAYTGPTVSAQLDKAERVQRANGKLRLITHSELKTFQQCHRKHHYAYRLRRRTLTSALALRFGSMAHTGLEAWWKAPGDAEAKLTAALGAVSFSPDIDAFEMVKVEELLIGYTAMWGYETDEAKKWKVRAVERVYRTELVNPVTNATSKTYELGGRIDIVGECGGEMALLEHKTTSEDISPGSVYWRRISALDAQPSHYLVGARSLGFDARKCTYDVIRKPAIRPLKATPEEKRKYTGKGLLYANQREHDESPEDYRLRLREKIQENPGRYFARGDIVRLASDQQEHALDTWQLARLVREAELAQRFPRNASACISFGRPCAYFDVCSGEADIGDDSRFRTAEDAHEELIDEESSDESE